MENFRFFPLRRNCCSGLEAVTNGKTVLKSVFLTAFLSVFRLWIMEATEKERRGTYEFQRTARKSVLCTVLWTVLYSARTQLHAKPTEYE